MKITPSYISIAVTAALSATSAMATPGISAVFTSYSTAGTPTAINISGSGLCASPCATPTLTLGGTLLTVTSVSATFVSANLPVLSDGDYTLSLTAGSSGSTTFALPIVAKSGVGATGPTGPTGAGGAKGAETTVNPR